MQLKKVKTKKIGRQKSYFLFYWDLARKILLRTEYMEIPCPKGHLGELGNLHAFTVFAGLKRFKKELGYLEVSDWYFNHATLMVSLIKTE